MTPCPKPPDLLPRRHLISLSVALFLSACGGGGSGAPPALAPAPTASPPPPPPPPTPGLIDFPIASRSLLFQPSGSKRLLFLGQDMVALGGITDGGTVYANGYLDDDALSPLPIGLTTYLAVTDSQGLTTTFHNSGEEKNAELIATAPAFAGTRPLLAIGYYLGNDYNATLNGSRDATLRTLAEWVKSKNLPVFLRIGYEFNASWTGHPSNKVGYINSFRYIASKLQQYGATNIAFVWQSDGQGTEGDLASYYPGDAYVDWVGYTHFDNKGEGMLAFARTHNKPVMVAEATPVGFNLAKAGDADGKRAWDGWFQPVLNHLQTHPEIRALAYINDNWPAKPMWAGVSFFNTTDSRIQRSAYVKAKWLAAMSDGTWFSRAEVLSAIGFTP